MIVRVLTRARVRVRVRMFKSVVLMLVEVKDASAPAAKEA
jgi:hypothetical protein